MLDLNLIHSTARSNEANSQGPKKLNETSAKGDADQKFQSEFDATADGNEDVDSAIDSNDTDVHSKPAAQEVEGVKAVSNDETEGLLSEISEEMVSTDEIGLAEDLPEFTAMEAENSDQVATKAVESSGNFTTKSQGEIGFQASSDGLATKETMIPQRNVDQRDVLVPRRSENTTAEAIIIAKASGEASLVPKSLSAKPDTVAVNDGETLDLDVTTKKPELQSVAAPSQVIKPKISINSEDVRSKRTEVNLIRRAEGPVEADFQVPTPKAPAPSTDPIQNLIALRASEEKVSLMPSNISEIEGLGSVETRNSSQSTGAPLAQVLNRSDTPAMVARQMAEALQRLPDQPVEISLNPKELGRVRMNISAAEVGITVNVVAERPETLDLMRRNIDQLAREFQSMGYEDINFAFSEGEAQQNFADEEAEKTNDSSSHIEVLSEEDSHTPQPLMASSNGVDIRL
ncbi:MAG: flagellar hook-length control protein FliK [Lentilitoribacter sp.]